MKVGYARTSTLDQQASFEAQLRELKDAKCEKFFTEQVSSVGGAGTIGRGFGLYPRW